MNDLDALESWAGTLLSKLSPAERKAVLIDVARDLRKSQQKRIAAQTNPDGTPFEPRKARAPQKNFRAKKGRIKRNAMFAKIRTAKFLKVETTADGLAIGFAGRVAKIARIHQEGQTAPVEEGGPNYTYPARRLLGLTAADIDLIRDKLLAHLVKP